MPVMWASPTSGPLPSSTTMPATTQSSVTLAGYETTDPAQMKLAAAQTAQWWKSFNDPILDSLVDRSMKGNLDLAQATARIREARATRSVITADLFPDLSVGGSYTRSGTGNGTERSTSVAQNGSTITRNISTGRDLYQLGLDASYEIDVFGGTRRNIEAADANLQAAIEDQRDVLVTLTSEVALSYLELRTFQREIVIAEANLKSQLYTSDLTRRRFKGGFIGALDVANADATVAGTQSQIPSLQQSARQSIYSLSVLLGQEPGTLIAELDQSGTIPSVPPIVPIGLPSELLKRRPDVRRADAALHAATARIGAAEADFFPRFSLTGSLTTQSNKIGGIPNWNNSFYSIGPSFSWPLFDAGRIRANVEVQKAVQEQQLAAYHQVVLVALQDVENALVAYAQEQQRRAALNEAVAANRKAVDVATKLYAAGNTDFLNVLNAQRSLLATEDSLVISDRTVATNLVALYKALGGGWDENQPPPTTQPNVTPLTIGP